MRMLIRYKGEVEIEALLLAAGRDRMRVVVPQQRDTVDLTRSEGCWRTESEQVVEIAGLISVAGADCSQFCAEVYPKTMSAGRNFTVRLGKQFCMRGSQRLGSGFGASLAIDSMPQRGFCPS